MVMSAVYEYLKYGRLGGFVRLILGVWAVA
jgi:hypothetical protein